MPQQRFDIGRKWLLQHQGKGALLVGGLKGVRRIEALPSEIVQNRKYPDGLLRVCLAGESKPHHVLVEVATYPEKRALKQALDDLTVAYNAVGHLPDLLMLVLRPKGRYRIAGNHEVRGKLGLSRLEVTWRTVEFWNLSAEQFLAEGDVGVIRWVPLTQFNEPPEQLLARCAEKIERESSPKFHDDLLAVSQVITELRFPNPELLSLFGGQRTMIESPLLKKMRAETIHEVIIALLKSRFGNVPLNVTKLLRAERDEKRLNKINILAAQCTDLDAFRDSLLS